MSPSSAGSKPSFADSDRVTGDGAVARFERAIAPYAHRFAEAPAVLALRESLPVALAAVVVALAALVAAQPFRGWAELGTRVRELVPIAFAIASVVMLVALSLRLAVRLRIPPGSTVAVALVTFWLVLPHGVTSLHAFAATLGASGLFTAIVVSLAAAGAIVVGRRRFGALRGDAAGGIALCALAAALYAANVSPAAALSSAIAPLATLGDSWAALALITAIESALWLVGIHGPALFAAIVLPVYLTLQAANAAAAGRHEPIPHIVVVSTFLFVFPGGAGATLPLVLLLLRSRVRRTRRVAMATLVPAIFNANEPLMFGLPLVSNPYLCVPFVIAPLVLALVTWEAIHLGLVARPALYVPSSIPLPFSVLLATKDWRAAILVAVNVSIALAIYAPFVRLFDRHELSEPTG
jgi:PTS system cellobiose-specific IIC component